jgi:hypothetical protein
VNDDGLSDGIEAIFANQAVVTQGFSAQEAPVGGEANLPQGGQITDVLPSAPLNLVLKPTLYLRQWAKNPL